MARISFMELRAKETNNFTDPEYIKMCKEELAKCRQEQKEYEQSKEYKELVAKREAEADANKALREAEAIAIIVQAEANKTLEKTPKTA